VHATGWSRGLEVTGGGTGAGAFTRLRCRDCCPAGQGVTTIFLPGGMPSLLRRVASGWRPLIVLKGTEGNRFCTVYREPRGSLTSPLSGARERACAATRVRTSRLAATPVQPRTIRRGSSS